MGLSEGDGCDGGSGVVADALQLLQTLEVARELASVALHHLARALVQVSRPGVIAQTLPHFQHLFLGGLGEVGQCGPTLDEAEKVVKSLAYTCLL